MAFFAAAFARSVVVLMVAVLVVATQMGGQGVSASRYFGAAPAPTPTYHGEAYAPSPEYVFASDFGPAPAPTPRYHDEAYAPSPEYYGEAYAPGPAHTDEAYGPSALAAAPVGLQSGFAAGGLVPSFFAPVLMTVLSFVVLRHL